MKRERTSCTTRQPKKYGIKRRELQQGQYVRNIRIKSMIHDLTQGELSVAKYFNILIWYWQQLDIIEELVWKYTEDNKQYKKIIKKERIYKFLFGLDKNLDEARGRILSTKPIPTIRKVFLEIRREESRRKVLGSQTIPPATEPSALAARGPQFNNNDNQRRKGAPWCEHCRKLGHTKETCWKINGKPADWKPSRPSFERDSCNNLAATVETQTSTELSPFRKKTIGVASENVLAIPVK